MPEYQWQDRWRREIAPRFGAFPPPPVDIDDFSNPENCVCIRINAAWVPFVTGVLALLLNRVYWDDSTDYSVEEIGKLIDALTGIGNSMSCENSQPVFSVDANGNLSYSLDGENFIALGNIKGAEGDKGEPGDTDIIEIPELDPSKTDNDRRCAAAFNMAEWLFDKYADEVDQIEAVPDVMAGFDAVAIIFGLAYLVVDGVTDAINEIVEAGVSVARTWDTVGNREALAESLYCLMSENGNLTTADWEELKGSLDYSGGNPAELAFNTYIKQFKASAAVQRSRISGYGDANLALCQSWNCVTEWCHVFDFTTGGQQGWYIYFSRGVWDTDGWLAADYNVGQDGVWIKYDFGQTVTLTSITVEFDLDPVQDDGSLQIFRDGDVLIEDWIKPDDEILQGDGQVRTWTGSLQMTTLYPFLRASAKTEITGTGKIRKITIEGTAPLPSPFGADNC